MNISGSTSTASLLNNMLTADNNKSIISVIQAKRAQQKGYLEQLLGSNSRASSMSKDDSSDYKKIVAAAEDVQSGLEALTSTEEDSLFAKAEAEGSTVSVTVAITECITSYNNMIKGMNEVGGTVYAHYGVSLQGIMNKYEEELGALGITQNSDGTLAIDQDVLGSASMEQLKGVFAGDSNFVEAALDKVADMMGTITDALSIKQSLLASYNNTGSSSVLSSIFGSSYSSQV